MDDGPSLDAAIAKLARARRHIEELKLKLREFRATHPYELRPIQASDGGQVGAWVGAAEPPASIGPIVGDVACNLRGALDQLVYALAWADSGKPRGRARFPIARSAKRFKAEKRKLRGLSKRHVRAIECLQPYWVGAWTVHLRDLSLPENHMRLRLVAAPGPEELRHRDDPSGPWLNIAVDFDVALSEAFPDGSPVVETLELLAAQVQAAISAFAGEFAPSARSALESPAASALVPPLRRD